MRTIVVIACVGLAFIACTTGKQKSGAINALNINSESRLLGTWQNVSLKIKVNSKKAPQVIEVDEMNWEDKMNIKPVKTIFFEDHTYRSEYYNLNDSIIRLVEGTWEILGDSLFLDQNKPEWKSYTYKVSINSDMATFEGVLDWDGDGEDDDTYIGVQKRQSI